MIATSVRLALGNILSPPFRTALWKSLGLSAIVLVGLWFAIGAGFETAILPFLSAYLPDMPAWIDQAGALAGWAAGLALAILLAFLIGPISAIIAGLFLDDVAEVIERESYPASRPGKALNFLKGLFLSLKFFGIVLLGNMLALLLLFVPGVNLIAFFVINGYLLGREYFEFAALRYRSEEGAKAMRARYKGTVFATGLVIAGFLAIPIVNLLTPLFAAALMVHLHQRISARDGGLPALAEGGPAVSPRLPGEPAIPVSAPEAPRHRSS